MSILEQHKAQRTAAKRAAIAELLAEIGAEASRLSGRFLVFGSAARGQLRHDSDLDLLLDFPDEDAARVAHDFAENACARLGLECDLVDMRWCKADFLDHVMKEARPVP